jgi:hypothetical protein
MVGLRLFSSIRPPAMTWGGFGREWNLAFDQESMEFIIRKPLPPGIGFVGMWKPSKHVIWMPGVDYWLVDDYFNMAPLLTISYWPAIGIVASPAALALLCRLRPRMSRASSLCSNCGYDLRATPEDQSRYPLNYASRIGAGRGH